MKRVVVVQRLDQLMAHKDALARRAAKAPLAQRLKELRAWQAARLARTYADLRVDPLFTDALEFFLSDLYGPQDLSRRDQDMVRAWRLLKRALPPRMLQVLCMTMELDVLSAELDLEVAQRLAPGPVTANSYADAYRAVRRPDARRRQIALVTSIGKALSAAVEAPLVGLALRAAHGPAHLSGFGVLQDFLERGFAAFRTLPDPARLLAVIEQREMHLMQILLAGGTICVAQSPPGAKEPA
jgi:hypothetical protein